MSSSSDNKPLVNRGGPSAVRHVNGVNGQSKKVVQSSDEDEDMPLVQEAQAPRQAARKRKAIYAESSDSDDDVPLSQSAAVPMPGAVAATTIPTKHEPDSDDDDDAPTGGFKAKAKPKITRQPPKKKVKVEVESEEQVEKAAPKKKATAKHKTKVESEEDAFSEDEEDEKPAKKKKAAAKKAAPKKRAKKEEDASDDDEEPQPRKKRAAKGKGEDGEKKSKAKKPKKEKEEKEAEEIFRWWDNNADGDGSEKWKTLVHSGVYFPPPYEPLPPTVKMKYDGDVVDLPPASEEVAGFYAALIETDHSQDAVFNKNFFNDWLGVLKRHPPLNGIKIRDFDKCDFRPIFEHLEEEKARKKTLTAAEKKETKTQRDAIELPYSICYLDGRKEKVGNFRVEPPGLFRGRGEHPKKGSLKHRLHPEDITINIGEDAAVPVPNMPGKWKDVLHKQDVTWLANWTENINGNHKYVFLAAGSSLKGQSDMMKFEKARELKNYVEAIRKDYLEDLKSKVMADRQRATAMYFIDRLALRAGNEKGEEEADTVGCCSLRCEHVTLEQPNFVIFDFLGKDSIRYYNRVPVDAQVFKNIRIFKENKEDEDGLFDRVNTGLLNKHLTKCMKGLTAKVFRTYNASITFQTELDKQDLSNATIQEKLNAYNDANRMVAILCNHQRAAPKTHDQSMDKMRYKLKGFQYERMKLRHVLFGLNPKYKKDKRFKDMEADIDEDFVALYEDEQRALAIDKARKKFAKENEKAAEDGDKPKTDDVLEGRIEDIDAEYDRLKEERGTGVAELAKPRPEDKLIESIEKLDERMKTFRLQIEDKDAGKEVALGTSKINYLDPRITAAWCKTHDVPIEKMFSKTLLVKFPWALEVEADWKF